MLEVFTVADDEIVVFDGGEAHHHTGLEPGTVHDIAGHEVRTLDRPPGELLCRFATVNDVHFGETECGVIEGMDLGPILSADDGERPYPEVMNGGAIAEIAAIDPAAVVAKGDLTARGIRTEYDAFLAAYEGAFAERLHHVRGNHDAYFGETFADDAPQLVELPGVRLAVLDTVRPTHTPGQVSAEQLAWLDDAAADATRDDVPVLVFGHHHVWNPEANARPHDYFGINPDDSEQLIDIVARQRSILGYFAGHTHRNRVRRFAATGAVPWVEVACVKDFPGSWAEYRVFEGGVLQVHHRIEEPAALAWSERCRELFGGLYPGYASGAVDDHCFAILPR